MTTMTPINPRLILDRLENGTLVRREWGDGRETACLLSAIHPPCSQTKDAAMCPATLMPEWLAELTPWFNDAPSADEWHGLVERYADLASRWWRVTDAAWTRLDYTCRRIAVAEARTHAIDNAEVLAVIDCVLDLLDRAIAGDMPTVAEWSEVRAAACETSRAAARGFWMEAAVAVVKAAEAAGRAVVVSVIANTGNAVSISKMNNPLDLPALIRSVCCSNSKD